MKTLFICGANAGRSQMAEGFYNHYTFSNDATSAAAYEDVRAKYGERPHKGIIATMAEKGIDISGQQITMLDEDAVKSADRIVVLCPKEKCPRYLQASDKALYKEVEDPFKPEGTPPAIQKEAFRTSRDEIEKLVKELIKVER